MILSEFLVVLYADHVRFHPRHPYIESLPTIDMRLTDTELVQQMALFSDY